MIKIGIVGDIGSGKSFVARQFNCPVFDADLEVKKIYNKDKYCFKKLKYNLPKHIYSFPIKKKEIVKAIIKSQNNLKKIVKVVHPIVRNKMKNFLKKNKNKKMVILDIPLLMENKLNKSNFFIVFIDANKKEMKKRLKKRASYNEKVFKKLKKFQLPLEFKKKKSNFIIKNNFKISSVKKNVKIIKRKIIKNERSSS